MLYRPGGWIAILILTLPGRYTSTDWQTVWVGLDLAELAGFAATGWAAWHQRQIVTFFMIITGTLLVCDASFDVALSCGSSGFTTSIVSALLVELPIAFLLFATALRLIRATIQILMELSGVAGQAPPLWRVPLFADGLEEALPARWAGRSRMGRRATPQLDWSRAEAVSTSITWGGRRQSCGRCAPERTCHHCWVR